MRSLAKDVSLRLVPFDNRLFPSESTMYLKLAMLPE